MKHYKLKSLTICKTLLCSRSFTNRSFTILQLLAIMSTSFSEHIGYFGSLPCMPSTWTGEMATAYGVQGDHEEWGTSQQETCREGSEREIFAVARPQASHATGTVFSEWRGAGQPERWLLDRGSSGVGVTGGIGGDGRTARSVQSPLLRGPTETAGSDGPAADGSVRRGGGGSMQPLHGSRSINTTATRSMLHGRPRGCNQPGPILYGSPMSDDQTGSMCRASGSMPAGSVSMVYGAGFMSGDGSSLLHGPQTHMPQTSSMPASRSGDGAVGSKRLEPAQPHAQTAKNEPTSAAGNDSTAVAGHSNKRKRRSGTWTDAQLAAAVAAFDAGCHIATAAKDICIPASSLRDHIYGKTMKRKKGRQGVLTVEEETSLVKWMMEMQDLAHPISILERRRKVAEITQERWTPFKDGIPGRGWLRWFRNRHPELTLRSPQGLEEGRARGLNPTSVASFYSNLQKVYEENGYSPSQIWNADESGAQAGRNGGGTLVFARKGSRSSTQQYQTTMST